MYDETTCLLSDKHEQCCCNCTNQYPVNMDCTRLRDPSTIMELKANTDASCLCAIQEGWGCIKGMFARNRDAIPVMYVNEGQHGQCEWWEPADRYKQEMRQLATQIVEKL